MSVSLAQAGEEFDRVARVSAKASGAVFIHHIIAAGTMDEMVVERRNSKRTVQDILLDAMKKEASRP